MSVTCLGLYPDPERLLTDARAQLTRWFGPAFDSWRILAHYAIAHALPAQPVGAAPDKDPAVGGQQAEEPSGLSPWCSAGGH